MLVGKRHAEVEYPDSDGERLAENTLQFEWIVTIKENLDALLPDFVGGDLLWYPVQGDPKTRVAPDALVALGRPKGYRGSYKQWEEGGVAPQVVFEVLSPGNTPAEMFRKLAFYQRYGVQEFYIFDPDEVSLLAWVADEHGFSPVAEVQGFVSPRLGIRFELGDTLTIRDPSGAPFLSFADLHAAREAERARADAERARADAERARAEAEQARADALAAELAALKSKLGEPQ